jgi:hypothetical protein
LEQVSTDIIENQTTLKLARLFESKATKSANAAAESALRRAPVGSLVDGPDD